MFTSNSMKSVGTIFWLSEKAKEFQVLLEEQYELPTYAVFIVIALATIFIGLTLGGVSIHLACSYCNQTWKKMVYINARYRVSSIKCRGYYYF